VTRRGDIPLGPPVVRAPNVVPAVEDRSYLAFIGGALAVALLGGFTLGVVVALSASGLVWEARTPWLTQAHGWAQLEGWAGLFVAGMGLRLLPRFAGRHPLSRRLSLTVFALLFSGVVLRTAAQPGAGNQFSVVGVLVGQLLWAVGAATFGVTVLVTLARGRNVSDPWRVFAFAGAAWWFVWAIASVAQGIDAARNEAFVDFAFDDALSWMVMLGAVGNFIWAVQSRSVPVFFGRKTPHLTRVLFPCLLLNAGSVLFLVAALMGGADTRPVLGAGFILAGLGTASLAPMAGSCWGRATRLRPRARPAARFVLVANNFAVASGILLIWAGGRVLADGEFAATGIRDAARHAFGVGVITMLIVGMAQLVAPFFALRRVESGGDRLGNVVLALLATAAVLRVASGLLLGHIDIEPRMHIAALAGSLAWLGLALFATMVVRAIRAEGGIKASLRVTAARPPQIQH
jgi:hypothetical protein